jgi:solute carrier family 8 (sodium/calcium exchanger)
VHLYFSTGQWFDEPKYLVTHSCLMEVLQICQWCAGHAPAELSSRHGAYVQFVSTCQSCHHTRTWATSTKHEKMPVINLLLSAAVLFSGSLVTKFLRALAFLSFLSPSVSTFHHYQRKYLHGVSCPLS